MVLMDHDCNAATEMVVLTVRCYRLELGDGIHPKSTYQFHNPWSVVGMQCCFPRHAVIPYNACVLHYFS